MPFINQTRDPFDHAFDAALAGMRRSQQRTATTIEARPIIFTSLQRNVFPLAITPLTPDKYALRTIGKNVRFATSDMFRGWIGLLDADNDEDEFAFDPAYAFYKDNPDLIKPSTVPLWYLKPVNDTTVSIIRTW